MTKDEVLREAWKLAHSCQEDAIWKALNYSYNCSAEIMAEQLKARAAFAELCDLLDCTERR